MQNLLRPQTYPYAGSSVGPYRGLLVQKYPCWDAQGPARDKFENEIVAKIKECLEQCLPESNSFVGFSLFMVGKAAEKTKPTIMIVTDDKSRRKEAFKMVKSKDILSSYPGFELGHCSVAAEFEDLQRLGRNTKPSASLPKSTEDSDHVPHMDNEYSHISANTNLESAAVCAFECPNGTKATRLYFHTSPHLHSREAGSATCSELFKVNGELYALTMAHAIQPPRYADSKLKQRDTYASLSSDSEDFEITGVEDWDEDDTNTLMAVTSQGSKTSSDDSESEKSLPSVPKPTSSKEFPTKRYSLPSDEYSSHDNTYGSSFSRIPSVSSVSTRGVFGNESSSSSRAYGSSGGTSISSRGTSILVSRSSLPCEFVGYGGCDITFDIEDVHSWIEHIASEHLRNKLPERAFCWYCDEVEFDSKRAGDRHTNFQQRMMHIREHIVYDGRKAHDIRPDHYFNKHLYEKGLIGEDAYNSVRKYSEVRTPPFLDASSTPQQWDRHKHNIHAITTLSVVYKPAVIDKASRRNEALPQKCEPVGSVIAIDMEMDIAVIKLNPAIRGKGKLFARKLPGDLLDPSIFSENPANTSITVNTTHHSQIKGQQAQMPFYTRLPGTSNFLKLYSVKLMTSLRPGDSGGCAYNRNGAIVGFVLAGNPNSVSCMLLPAMPAIQSMLSLLGHSQPNSASENFLIETRQRPESLGTPSENDIEDFQAYQRFTREELSAEWEGSRSEMVHTSTRDEEKAIRRHKHRKQKLSSQPTPLRTDTSANQTRP
ncbi:hypothetical protein F5Y08DRAFT_334819 [Xylaria arbuscula]|nr:hypothetical protein F5Y08DRAFT_334819 [Xylaria arbuscula]